MKKIKMLTSYREIYKPNDEVWEDDTKADQLINLGRAILLEVKVEESAPMNKEVTSFTAGGNAICEKCGRGFASKRGLLTHAKKCLQV